MNMNEVQQQTETTLSLGELELEGGDGLGGVESLGASLGAIHDRICKIIISSAFNVVERGSKDIHDSGTATCYSEASRSFPPSSNLENLRSIGTTA